MIGSLNSIQATAEKLSIPQLQQAMRDGTLPPYVGIPLLQKKVQMQKQMQMASQLQQPKKPSIAEQVNQEASADEMMRQRARMMQAEMGQTGGISDFLPKGEESYAKGGPIAFAKEQYVDPRYTNLDPFASYDESYFLSNTPAIDNLLNKNAPNRQAPDVDQAQAMQNRIAARKAPVAGSVAPVVQTPYVQAAPVEQAPAPQVAPETILSAAERAKQFKEALGEDVGRADAIKRLAEREAATAKQEERAPWLGLMQAGLATMAGTSPFAMANIGAGGVAGLNAYMKAQDKLDAAKENHDAILAQLNKAQRAEDVAAYKFGADSEQADKALAARERLQDKELASREKMNREDNAVRREGYAVNREIAGMRMVNTGASGGLKPYQADQLRKSAVSAADKVLSNMLSPEYKEYSALKTKAEQKQYKQNLVDSYFATFRGAVPSASAAAQAPYDLNWVP
jgi:hypothetical protein